MEVLFAPPETPVQLHVPIRLNDDLFFAICQANRECRIERTALGWLILPRQREAQCFFSTGEYETLHHPIALSGEPVLPGFTFHLARVWQPGL